MSYKNCFGVSTSTSKRFKNTQYLVHLRTCANRFLAGQPEENMNRQQKAKSRLSGSTQYRGSKILVVEDNNEVRELIVTFLKQSGFLVAMACNGLEAIRLFHQEKFDIVLTDICIPGINGNILAKQMKSFAGTIPIIAITGTPTLAGHHFDKVLAKPFDLELLLETIRTFLDKAFTHSAGTGLLHLKEIFTNRKTRNQ